MLDLERDPPLFSPFPLPDLDLKRVILYESLKKNVKFINKKFLSKNSMYIVYLSLTIYIFDFDLVWRMQLMIIKG